MGKFTPLDFEEYVALARQAAAEGCVLLKNDNEALPLRKGDKVAVFGRIAFHYYKSGLGSGGLVNTKYVVGILDALKEEKDITLDENLLGTYEKWIEENPYDEGQGWGKVPWSQKEMELTDEIVESAKGADAAIVVVGRTAGEDQDNKNEAGSYLLTDTEREMVEKVSKAFARTIVVLNVGNIIDMKWVKECNPAAVLYVWQGGQEGGNGVACGDHGHHADGLDPAACGIAGQSGRAEAVYHRLHKEHSDGYNGLLENGRHRDSGSCL